MANPRPQLTVAILLYAVVEAGMVLLPREPCGFVHRKPLFIPGFPGGMIGAGVALVEGCC